MEYIPITEHERKSMLGAMGLSSFQELFAQCVPDQLLQKTDLDLPPGLAEQELLRHMQALAGENQTLDDVVSFLGAGCYDHLIPAVIKHITSRGEFITAYTPYQAEVSQGVLQSIFEFQTFITQLTGMEAANASMYDGATALAEAALMACSASKRNVVAVPANVHPEWREVVSLFLQSQDIRMEPIPYLRNTGTIDLAAVEQHSQEIGCMLVQQPNFFGALEDMDQISELVHRDRALLVAAVDPISLGLLKAPGTYGADIVVGDGQALGNPPSFGGPSLGFLATSRRDLIRRMPGRIVGETIDAEGKRGFVLTLQTREQHIRREKATSNICTNQALNALAAAVYLAVVGKQGLQDVAYQCLQKASYLQRALADIGLGLRFDAPYFKEFVIQGQADWLSVNDRLLDAGFLGGLPLGLMDPALVDSILISVTEARTKDEMDRFVDAIKEAVA